MTQPVNQNSQTKSYILVHVAPTNAANQPVKDAFVNDSSGNSGACDGTCTDAAICTGACQQKLQWLVDEKKAEGWDDPRFPTVAGILRHSDKHPRAAIAFMKFPSRSL